MFNFIITILTTSSVVLHATLGCCAHHSHSCDSHELGAVVVVSENGIGHCSHQHQDNDESQVNDTEEHRNHQHNDDEKCDESDCSFVSSRHENDVELMLVFSNWCHAASDLENINSLGKLLSLHNNVETPLDPLTEFGSLRAITQVCRV